MSRLSCSNRVQLVVAGLPTAPVHSLLELDRQLGRVRDLCVGSREVSLVVPSGSRGDVQPFCRGLGRLSGALDVCSSGMVRCSLPSWGVGPASRLRPRDETCSVLSPSSFGLRGGVRHGRHVGCPAGSCSSSVPR